MGMLRFSAKNVANGSLMCSFVIRDDMFPVHPVNYDTIDLIGFFRLEKTVFHRDDTVAVFLVKTADDKTGFGIIAYRTYGFIAI